MVENQQVRAVLAVDLDRLQLLEQLVRGQVVVVASFSSMIQRFIRSERMSSEVCRSGKMIWWTLSSRG